MTRPTMIRSGRRIAPVLSIVLSSLAAGGGPAFSQAADQATPNVTAPAAPAVTPPTPAAAPLPETGTAPANGVKPLTLDAAVALALSNNSSVLLARERVKKAAEQITQATAQAYPNVRIDVGDTLSSTRGYGSGVTGGSSSGVTLPGGGVIPTITDQGGGTVQTFVGGGGGGNSTGTGAGGSSTTTSPSATSPSTTGGGTVNTGVSGGGTSGGGTGTGAGGTSTGTGTGGASSNLLQKLSDETKSSGAVSHADTGTGTGSNASGGGSQGNYNTYGARLTVTQGIDIFRLVPAAEDVLKRTRDFYQVDLDRVSNEVALSVKNAFFTLLRDQESVRVQQEQVTANTENVRIAQAKFGAGTVAQYDVLTAQTTLSSAQQALYKAQNQVNIDQANLNAALGTPADAATTVDTASLPAPTETFSIPESTATAYVKRPEMIQADNNITIAEKLIKLAGATMKPSLSLTGSAGYAGTPAPGSKRDTYSLAANLGFPLYDGGTTKSKVRSAEIDLDTQKITKAQLQQNVAIEVRQAILNIENAKSRVASATQGVTQAREAVRLANVRYQNGISAFIEVTNAQAQLVTAENDQVGAFYDYQTSRAQLIRAIGGR
ncbi:MAG: TolC family protein [Capsulimonas sp.]|uniref:TolC family protein n=1 Tax=Capsulimonas sp. TaxID=2494211 RepID=UPI0032668876